MLEITFIGATLTAGLGHLDFAELPRLLSVAAGLLGGRALSDLRYNPYDYAIHEDPYPTYARMRAEAPVYRNDELDFWVFSRHHDVLAAFRDVKRFSNSYGVSLDPAAFGPNAHRSMSFLALDPPAHTRLRSIVGKAFTVRRVAEMEPRIRELALEHAEPALERGSFDFISNFAGRLPMDVHAQVAMQRFCRMQKQGRRAGGTERGRNFLRNDSALAHPRDHHASALFAAAQNQLDGAVERGCHRPFKPRGQCFQCRCFGAH